MLDGPEQILFRRLAVFAGSFGLDAAEAICAEDDLERRAVLDALASLVAKSLVGSETGDGGRTRYRLLESVRMYAAEKLAQAGEAERVRAGHRDWYVSWLGSIPLEALTFATGGTEATRAELENLRDQCYQAGRPSSTERRVEAPAFTGNETCDRLIRRACNCPRIDEQQYHCQEARSLLLGREGITRTTEVRCQSQLEYIPASCPPPQ